MTEVGVGSLPRSLKELIVRRHNRCDSLPLLALDTAQAAAPPKAWIYEALGQRSKCLFPASAKPRGRRAPIPVSSVAVEQLRSRISIEHHTRCVGVSLTGPGCAEERAIGL